jgi:hypothetical protein
MGLLYAGEFVGRIILVYRVPAAVVLVVSPVVTGIGTILAILWTFWNALRVRQRLAYSTLNASTGSTQAARRAGT